MGHEAKTGRTLFLLLVVAGLPVLLCSGMATALVGPGFGRVILGWIVLVYCLIACMWLVAWLTIGRPAPSVVSPENEANEPAP